jgi:hypothetical protein
MHRFLLAGLIALCLTVAAQPVFAQAKDKMAASEAVDADLAAFAELMDLRELMAYALDRSAELAGGIPNMPPEMAEAWEQAVRNTYDPDGMTAVALDTFAAQMSAEAIAEAVSFLRSPVGQRLRAARQSFRDRPADAYDVQLEREQALASTDPRRHGLYRDLGEAMQADADFAETQILMRALLTPSYGETLTEEYVHSVLELYRSSLPNIRTMYAMQLLPDMAESDLEAILDFFRTPAGQEIARVEVAVYPAVIEAEIDALSADLAARLQGR